MHNPTNLSWDSLLADAPPLDAEFAFGRELTKKLFAAEIAFEDRDPSYSSQRWIVVSTTMQGSAADILAREAMWHQHVWQALGAKAGRFALCVCSEAK